MPWIVTIPTDNRVGPGVQVQATSNFNGPFETGTTASFVVFPQGGETAVYTRGFQITNDPSMRFQLYDPTDIQQPWPETLSPGAPCTVRMILNDPRGGVLDESDFSWAWTPSDAIGPLVQANSGRGQGLTPAQAQQLLETQQATVPVLTQDEMGLSDLTGPNGVSDLVIPLASPVFGVIVRITQLPAELTPISADPDYWRTTLARVSIFRGGDLWQRYPVHTQNRMFMLPGNNLAAGIAALPSGAWLLNMSLQLSTFPGVLAQVLLMTLP